MGEKFTSRVGFLIRNFRIAAEMTQKELANKLNICLYEDVVDKVLIKLFDVANRKPGMTVTYTEKEGRKIDSSGSVFF